MSAELDWMEETRDFGEQSLRRTRTANEQERAHLCETLGLLSCDRLVFDYELRARSKGRYVLRGELTAQIAQACVVSLEPVASDIREAVRLEFWPPEALEATQSRGERSILEGDDPEPLGPHGRVETGRIATEILSAALDPYPRKEGPAFRWSDEADTGENEADIQAGPFGVLKSLKPSQNK